MSRFNIAEGIALRYSNGPEGLKLMKQDCYKLACFRFADRRAGTTEFTFRDKSIITYFASGQYKVGKAL